LCVVSSWALGTFKLFDRCACPDWL